MQTLTFPIQVVFDDLTLDSAEQRRQACAEIEEAVTEALIAHYGSVSVVAFSPGEGEFQRLACVPASRKG
ncbi:MAG: hypothetical protein KDJ44_01835 [Rhodoblastus sp.]|nr:hypothetical protein [Rhodoblastus sp.]MCC2106204.1 hypothetical protein [Hyphomicrobiales bacterium]